MKLISCILLVIIVPAFCYSQNTSSIEGIVMDSLSRPISGASVIVYTSDKKKIVAFAITDAAGAYSINAALPNSEYLLEVSAINFEKQTISLFIKKEQKNYQNRIVLQTSLKLLKEVVVTAKSSGIKQKGDTTEYTAARFRDANTKTLEELLKKLPGITVNEDGTIMIKGKQVEKVLVEGDDMFDRKYDLLTKNFTATAIDKIQAIDNYVENALHKGIESSDKIILNVTLDAAFKNKLSGNLDVGIGNRGFYDTKNTIFSIARKAKFIVIANHNNIGRVENNADEYLFDRSGFLKDNTPLLYQAGEANLPQFKTNRFSNIKSNLNVITGFFHLSPNIKVKSLLYGLYGRQQTSTTEYEQYNFSNNLNWESLLQSDYAQKPLSVMGNLETNIKLKDSAAIKHNLYYNYQRQKYQNTALSSLSFIDSLKEEAINKPKEVFSRFLYTKRLPSASVLDVNYDFYIANIGQEAIVFSDRYFSLFGVDNSYRQLLNEATKKQLYQQASATYLKGWHGHKLSAKIGYESQQFQIASDLQLQNKFASIQSPYDYRLSIKTRLNDYSFQLSDAVDWKRLKFKFSMNVRKSFFRQENYKTDTSFKRTSLFVQPSISVAYRITKRQSINFSYNNSADNPAYTNLLPDFYLRSISSFERGTNQFQRIYKHSFFAGYFYSNFLKQVELSASFFRTTTNKNYVSSVLLSPSLSFNTLLPFDGGETNNINAAISKLFPVIKANIKLDMLHSQITYYNAVNGKNNLLNKMNTYSAKFRVYSIFDGVFNYDVQFGYQQVRSRAATSNAMNSASLFTGASIFKFQLAKPWFLLLKSEWYKYQQQSLAVFCDAKLTFNPGNSRFGYGLSLQNMLNVKSYTIRTVTPLQVNVVTYRVIPFYGIFNVSYSF